MSHNKVFEETTFRKELSKLSKLQLIKLCKSKKVSTNNSKKVMIDELVKYEKKQIKKSPKTKRTIKSNETMDKLKLLKLFQRSQNSDSDNDKFDEFIAKHPDKFVISVINIMFDKTANSVHERHLQTMLFHQFRGDPSLWLNLSIELKSKLKSKLLKGITTSNKIDILAHIIAVITTFEEWDELIPELIDIKSGKEAKLKILAMIGNWAPDRLKKYSLEIANIIYPETLNVESDQDSHESLSLFRILNSVMRHNRDVLDIILVIKIMKISLVFLLKHYVTNYEELNLFDSDSTLNVDINNFNFNKLDCDFVQPLDAAKVYLDILCQSHAAHFSKISNELHNEMFFILNVFLKISGDKIGSGLIQYDGGEDDWDEENWEFAIIAQFLFTIFYNFHDNNSNYFYKMNDKYDFIANIISNIDYDILHESVFSQWTYALKVLNIDYFWNQKDLFVELLHRKHPISAYKDMIELKSKLCEPERFAVKWFIRNNYPKLDNEIHIPIVDIVLKYLSEYVSIDIVKADCDDHEQDIDYLEKIISKQNQNLLQETVIECVIDTLLNNEEIPHKIIKEIYSYLPYSESTIEKEIMTNYVLCPMLDKQIPCIVISPQAQNMASVAYNLSSLELKLGWFASHDKDKWPINGKYYICVQEFDIKNPVEPNNEINKILFKSKIFEITTQDYEICKLYDINLRLNNEIFYVVYVVQLDPSLDEEEINKIYKWNNTDYSIESNIDYYSDQTSVYWKKTIGLPCTEEQCDEDMLMTTFIYYDIKDKQYHNRYGYSGLYDITFNCV